jgi:hypothetical protein
MHESVSLYLASAHFLVSSCFIRLRRYYMRPPNSQDALQRLSRPIRRTNNGTSKDVCVCVCVCVRVARFMLSADSCRVWLSGAVVYCSAQRDMTRS